MAFGAASLALFCSATIGAQAQQAGAQARKAFAQSPKFTEYPVEVFSGEKPPLLLIGEDRRFRTRYRNLYKDKPYFAGHYGVSVVGCGMGCIFLLAVDLKSGKPFNLGVDSGEDLENCSPEYRDANDDPVDKGFWFRPNSRLFVVTGRMDGMECGARFFEEKAGQLVFVKDIHLEKTP